MFKTLLLTNKPLALILIRAQKEVFSSVVGNNNSRQKGEGYDFVELRPYESGDDSKHIDWMISSKMNKPHVKVFHPQKELNIAIVALLSGSVYFGTKRLKHELITEISALISYSCVKQNDPFEAYIANEDFFVVSKKSKQLFSVRTLVEKISDYGVLGKQMDYKGLVGKLYKTLRQKSLVFLIGDFFDTQDLDLKALAIKHELVVIIVRDRFEENPTLLGMLDITDPVTKKSAKIDFNKTNVKNYLKKMQLQDEILLKQLKKLGIKFVKIFTDENPAQKVLTLMSRR